MHVKKRIALNIFLLLGCFTLLAQRDTINFNFRHYGFENLEENEIYNIEYLSDFFEKLYQLRKGAHLKVNIIQVGDSHIQADVLSGKVRQNIQRDFGNAGRGLIVPGKVARTNEPSNINTSSAARWEVKRIVFPEIPIPIGIGGITIRTQQPLADLTIRTINYPIDYRFDRLTLFFKKDLATFNLAVRDSANRDLAFIGPFIFNSVANTAFVLLPGLTNEVSIKALPPTSTQNHETIFGINLENGKSGTLFHSIGVNGAKYRHFTAATYFAEQTEALHPDLVIFSLGTNEALDYPFVDPQLSNQIDQLIKNIKEKNPGVKFILTTPPGYRWKQDRRNWGLLKISETLIGYAKQNNIAFWDLYSVGGGTHAADAYQRSGLLQQDGIHFTVAGYELQGNLLYQALIRGYNIYVSYRHP